MALLALSAFNLAIADLIQRDFLMGTTEGFNHLQIYFVGLLFLFLWLPLLGFFGAYIGPRSQTGAFWPYVLGLLATLVAFVCVRFLFVENALADSLNIVRQVVSTDIGVVRGGQYIALVAVLAVFLVMLLILAGIPWLVARTRRRIVLGS